jgi:hypothetical protein
MDVYAEYLKSEAFQNIYGEKLNAHTADLILRASKESIRKKTSHFRMLDFGAAHCRYFGLTQYLEQKFPDTQIEYIGFDPFPEAFDGVKKKLLDEGFTEVTPSDAYNDKTVFTYGTFKKGNRTLTLLHAADNVNFSLDELKSAAGDVNLSMILLGTLSHIETGQRRTETMKAIGEITDGLIFGEVGFLGKSFQQEVARYSDMRARHEDVGKAKGSGDFCYDRTLPGGKEIKIFAHAFTEQELLGELHSAGLSTNLVTTNSSDTTPVQAILEQHEMNGDNQADPDASHRTEYLFIACNPKKHIAKGKLPDFATVRE